MYPGECGSTFLSERVARREAPGQLASQATSAGLRSLPPEYKPNQHASRLLGVQLFGHRHAEIAKRVDIAAASLIPGHDGHYRFP